MRPSALFCTLSLSVNSTRCVVLGAGISIIHTAPTQLSTLTMQFVVINVAGADCTGSTWHDGLFSGQTEARSTPTSSHEVLVVISYSFLRKKEDPDLYSSPCSATISSAQSDRTPVGLPQCSLFRFTDPSCADQNEISSTHGKYKMEPCMPFLSSKPDRTPPPSQCAIYPSKSSTLSSRMFPP